MDNTLNFELTTDDPDEINKFLDQYLAALDRSLAEMAERRKRIDRINAENEAARAYLRELMRKAE